MQVELKMPDLATTDAEVKVIKWLVEVGQSVQRGQPVLEVETDKAAMEVESFVTGVLKAVRAQPGDEVEAGDVIAVIETQGDAPAAAPAEAATPTPPPAPSSPAEPTGAPASPKTPPKRRSRFARNREAGAQPAQREAEAPAPEALTPAQRTVARRMQLSKQTVPHFYLQTSADAEAMIARRGASSTKIVWDAFFVCAVARALEAFERMGCRFEDDRLVPQATQGVGVAIDVAGDLYVAPVEGATSKTLEQVSQEIREAADRIRSGDPQAKKLHPNAITVTNLGVANVESFLAIVNPPESAILAVGKVAPAVVARDGQAVVANRVSLTLSVDHRVTSGKYAADFLGRIVEELESF